MGVTGLWRLIEPAGKPVPVETLENKVLAVDISIWLHQMVKGYQDAKGAPLPNAHLVGLFQRLCKLLYFRVKPVFVFDGGFPDLKKETIAKRQDNKAKYNSESERIKRELALLLNKKTAIGSLLGKQTSPKKSTAGTSKATSDDDIFKLPALPVTEESDTESEDEESSSSSIVDLHSIDVESDNFKKLSVKEKYDLLIELKETRKMNSWGKLHELPKKSDNFSDFQMQRLLKRRKVQECLEETEKEMGDTGMSLTELESFLNAEGIDTKIEALPTRRIASNNNTRFLLINNVKQALADVKKKNENGEKADTNTVHEVKDEIEKNKKDELEDDLQKAIKMSLECVDDHDSSAYTSKTDDSWTSYLSDSDYSPYDSEEEDGCEPPDMTSAKAYILQYCDFTNEAVDAIVSSKNYKSNKHKGLKVARIIEELNKEKSIIIDKVELSSEEEEYEEKTDSNNKKIVTDSTEDSCSKKNVNTQSLVVCIENPSHEFIALDTDTENHVQENPIKPKELSIKMETVLSEDDEQFEDIPEAHKSSSEVFYSSKALMNNTQASVICLEKSTQEVINLDISLENDVEQNPINKDKAISLNMGSESSDEDQEFEDVSDTENINKPVVELTLNMDVMPDDDIFADVFDKRVTSTTETIVSSQDKKYSDALPIGEAKRTKKDYKREGNIDEQSKLQIIEKENTINKYNTNTADSCISVDNEKIDSDCKIHHVNIENDKQMKNSKLSEKVAQPVISTETLNSMVTEVETQEQVLLEEKGRLDRIGRNITEQMTKEAQELLQIFGIPYIVAPMEAEAQCAFLEAVKLTDGTITDDSDIWLFGGKTVYKNFFNHKKHVSQFLAERIEKSFNLTREQLVLLALLVGSDYTMGLTGVGPVTALEILATFPFNKRLLLSETSSQGRYRHMITGLQEFKKWVRTGKRTDDTSLKKKLKNVAVTDDFPSLRVVQAYLEPNVEKSEEKFTWGQLDITIIRDYAKAKFGWSQNKLDEIIKPVLKRLEERKTQKNINDYFKKKIEFQALEEQLSKRVKAAVQRMGPELPQEASTSSEVKTKTGRKRKTNKKQGNQSSDATSADAGPSQIKLKKYSDEESALGKLGVKVVSTTDDDGKSMIQITIPKSDRVQEIIPQREKDKKCLLQNKMRAIEVFRKSKLDPKNKTAKRKVIVPKEKAELSESDSD